MISRLCVPICVSVEEVVADTDTCFLCSAFEWWSQPGSNRRPQACKASALPTELWPRSEYRIQSTGIRIASDPAFRDLSSAAAVRRLVGPGRVERPTSRLSGVRSNHLSYEPVPENRNQKSGIRKSDALQTKSRAEAEAEAMAGFGFLTSDSTEGRETKAAAVADFGSQNAENGDRNDPRLASASFV
jgi:hypothetical protein